MEGGRLFHQMRYCLLASTTALRSPRRAPGSLDQAAAISKRVIFDRRDTTTRVG
jgi:hypothetical protein